MPVHVPIMLAVKGARGATDKLDEATAVGDPAYFERSQTKHFIPKLPHVLKNGLLKLVGQGPKLTPEEEAEWRRRAEEARAEAAVEAAAAKERKAAAKAAKRQDKEAEKAAKRQRKDAERQRKAADKEARRAGSYR